MQITALLKSQPPNYRNRIVDYEQFYLIVINRGTLYFGSVRQSAAIRPGGMAMLRRGSRFILHTEDDGYDGIAVSVLPADVEPFCGESAVLSTTLEIATITTWLTAELTAPGLHGDALIASLGQAIVHYALRRLRDHLPGEPQEARQRYWASRVASAIAGSLYTDRNIEQILAGLEPSHRQVSRYLKAERGRSPKQYQLELKMREACRLLENTRLSVTTIALELGFPSVQHFCAQFRQAQGKTPTHWRRQASG